MIVAFTVSCQRRDYFRRTLDSWHRVRGFDQVPVLACLEHYHAFRSPKEAALEREFDGFEAVFPHIQTVRNTGRLGCMANTRQALDRALTQSEFAVLAEEDVEVADDILEYMTWAAAEYAGDSNVLAVCAHSVWSKGNSAHVTRASWFTPLVWGTWRDRWDRVIVPNWKAMDGIAQGWDATLRQLTRDSGMSCVYPALSRAQHFGAESTMTPLSPVSGSNWFNDRSQSRSYRGHYEPQEYREVEAGSIGLEYY